MDSYEVYDGELHVGTLDVKGNRHRYVSCAPEYENEKFSEQDWGKEILYFHNLICAYGNDDVVLKDEESEVVLYRVDEE